MRRKAKKTMIQRNPMIIFGLGFLLSVYFQSWIMGVLCIVLIYGGIQFIPKLLKRQKAQKLKQSGIYEIDQMDGIQFEHFLSALFNHQNYKVKVTAASGDYGADLIAKKDGEKIVIQAKRYSKPVGIKAVQEVTSAKLYYSATEAWVVTNNKYTPSAIELAKTSNVRLIDRDQLIPLILDMNPNALEMAKKTVETVKPKDLLCKKCGSRLIVKNGKHGRFYGCVNFPGCTETKAM